MTKIKIKVGKEEIMKGECGNVSKCAIALAITSVFGRVGVDGTTIDFYLKDGSTQRVNTPRIASDFIERFDECTKIVETSLGIGMKMYDDPEMKAKLEEIEFEIEVPDKVLEDVASGSIEDVKKIISQSKTLELV